MADKDSNGNLIPLTKFDYYFATCGDFVIIDRGNFTLTMSELYQIFSNAAAYDSCLHQNQRRVIEKMITSLKAIAFEKGESGLHINENQCREIAKTTLQEIGLI